MTEFVRLPKPKPCIACGQPADFADAEHRSPLHDLCSARIDRLADRVNAAYARRMEGAQ